MDTYRKIFNDKVEDFGNRLYEGLGDLLTKEVESKKAAACTGLFIALSNPVQASSWDQMLDNLVDEEIDIETVQKAADELETQNYIVEKLHDYNKDLKHYIQETEAYSQGLEEDLESLRSSFEKQKTRYEKLQDKDSLSRAEKQQSRLLENSLRLTYHKWTVVHERLEQADDLGTALTELRRMNYNRIADGIAGTMTAEQLSSYQRLPEQVLDILEENSIGPKVYQELLNSLDRMQER